MSFKLIKISSDLLDYLDIFTGLKAFARQEALVKRFGETKAEALKGELIALNLLKVNKRGAISGPSWDEVKALIAFNRYTIEAIDEAIAKAHEALKAKVERNEIEKTKSYYFLVSQELGESMAYTRSEIERLNKMKRDLIKAGLK